LNIVVNGDTVRVDDGASILDLIHTLELTPDRLAVELNRRIIRRPDWASTRFREGDHVEIVHFVGGGQVLPGFDLSQLIGIPNV